MRPIPRGYSEGIFRGAGGQGSGYRAHIFGVRRMLDAEYEYESVVASAALEAERESLKRKEKKRIEKIKN